MKSFYDKECEEIYKPYLVEGASFSKDYELPILQKVTFKPTKAIPFDKARQKAKIKKVYKEWLHFYLDDHVFECVWRKPKKYLDLFKKFEGVITPDFSAYSILPLVMQAWNIYRNRALTYWLQKSGINIVPNIRWGDERSYGFAFSGIEQGDTIATSTNGCIQYKEDRDYFKAGLAEMVKVIQPETIINYSQTPDDIFLKYKKQGIEVIAIENWIKTVSRSSDIVSPAALGLLTVRKDRY